MRKVFLLALVVASAVTAQDITVCRQGQAITIPIQSLSPYDEIGGCGASYFYIPATDSPAATAAPATALPDQTTATTTPMPMPGVATLPSASDMLTPAPTSSLVAMPISAPVAATPSPADVIATLGPNAIVPDNAVRPPSPAMPMDPAAVPVATVPTLVVPALPPNDMPIAGSSMAQPVPAGPTMVGHEQHADEHEWQAAGSFHHGHMESVIKANHAIPADMDPNDPKTRVLVFLQFFTSNSVYDNPQPVFMFFTKPQDIPNQRSMRIN